MTARPATRELLGELIAVERRFPVAAWTADGVHLWPLLRIDAFMREWAAHNLDAAASPGAERLDPVVRLLGGPLRAWQLRHEDRAGVDRQKGPIDVLFLSDGVSFANLGGRWVDKFCDPLRRRLDERGVKSAMWTLGHRHRKPRFSPATPVQGAVDRAKLRGELRARLGRVPCELPAHADVVDALSARPRMTAALADFAVASLGAKLRAAAELFAGRLRQLRPSLVFVVSYYSLEAMALIRACRTLGIATVDLQHGVQGALHPAYSGWLQPPAAHCHELLPDRFWVWSDDDARNIEQWAASTGHTALVAGNPWAQLWNRAEPWPGVAAAHRAGAALRSAAGARLAVLVSLQHGFADAAQIATVKALADQAGDQAHWWVRLHPVMLDRREAIRAGLAGVANIELDVPTDLPLPVLLDAADVHLTPCSSVVLEAGDAGVPTLLTSSVGGELYPAQLAAGTAVLRENDAAAQWEVLRMLAGRRDRGASRRGGASAAAALDRLLAGAGLGGKPVSTPRDVP